MSIVAHEAQFHTVSRYATQLLTSEEERIRLYVKGLNYDLPVLYVHITLVGKGSNDVLDL